MIYRIIILICISLLFTRCNFEIEGELLHVYKLTSPDKRIEIYESEIESNAAFASGFIETTILNAGEKYNPRLFGNFSGYQILGWVGNDTLKVIKFHEKQANEIKISNSKLHEIKKYGDFYLDIVHFTSFGGGWGCFRFDTLYFKKDSVFFLQYDSLENVKKTLGLLKGQIRLSLENDTISIIEGEYFERIEKHFAKITEGNELGYPYVVGTNTDIIPKYRLKSSIFKGQSITLDINIKDYK